MPRSSGTDGPPFSVLSPVVGGNEPWPPSIEAGKRQQAVVCLVACWLSVAHDVNSMDYCLQTIAYHIASRKGEKKKRN